MDIYGHGQSIGAMITCYCKKNNIDIDDLTTEMKKPVNVHFRHS